MQLSLCGGDCAGVYETGIAYCGCRSRGGGFSCTDDWILKTSGMDFSENNGEIYPGSFIFKRRKNGFKRVPEAGCQVTTGS